MVNGSEEKERTGAWKKEEKQFRCSECGGLSRRPRHYCSCDAEMTNYKEMEKQAA